MLIVDIILVLLILGYVGIGAKDGFLHTLGRLIGAVIGYVVAKMWYVQAAVVIGLVVPDSWSRVVAFILIFLLISRLCGIVVKLLDGIFHILKFIPFFKTINSFLGAIIGLFEGIIVLGAIIYVVKVFQFQPTVAGWLAHSYVAPWLQRSFTLVLSILL